LKRREGGSLAALLHESWLASNPEEKETEQMNSDPLKAALLKFLISWVSDWHKDSQSLIAAMSRASRPVSVSSAYPRSTVPNPPPPPEMSSSPQDYEWCAAYFQVIAYNNYATALGVLNIDPDPHKGDLAGSLGYDDVNSLDATNEWMRLTSGLFKSMLLFYPIASPPGPLPQRPPSAPDDDEGTFWTSLKNELQKQAQLIVDFVDERFSNKAMKMPMPANAQIPSKSQCILMIEQCAHQVFMDYCRIANHLPDHFSRPATGFTVIHKTK
jgi:hypothetical protein